MNDGLTDSSQSGDGLVYITDSNVRPGEKTLYAERYAVDATLVQIRLAWAKFENATTMGEIQSALSELSRLVHGDA